MGRFSTVVLSAVTLAAACCAVVAGTVLPAGASPQPAGTWGSAQQVPGVWALSRGSEISFKSGINSLSCASAGNCAAGGAYVGMPAEAADVEQAFVVDETGGSWGMAQDVPGLAALGTGYLDGDGDGGGDAQLQSVINSLSCGAAGNCAAGGLYVDSAGDVQAFVVAESGGSWGAAEEVPGLAALNAGGWASVSSVSCPSAGNCAAVGTYTDAAGHAQGFVVAESGGLWGNAEEVPGSAGLDAGGSALLNSVSCASAGNCAAGGWYAGSDGEQAFVVDETAGTWGTAQEVPGSAALNTYGGATVTSVSCPSAGNCTAVGSVGSVPYLGTLATPQAFVVDETAGSWGSAELLPGTAPWQGAPEYGSVFDSVSCGSAGNCVAAGYLDTGDSHPMVAEESGGSWGAAWQVPGLIGSALSVSCASAGNCAVGGTDSASPASFVLDETGGSWGTAQELPGLAGQVSASISSVSCPSAGNCAAGGSYVYAAQSVDGVGVAFVVSEKPTTSTIVALSTAKVTYGKEQAERVSVTVSAPSGGTPSGTVTVKAGTAVVCGSVELSAGRASCTVAATKLPAGTWHLTASYSGSTGLAASTSAGRILTVVRAAAKITLSLSAARVTYGQERSERLTVTVIGQYGGMPGGKVTVESGSTTVCAITLASGKGSCVLAARKLPVGTRTLVAVYGGNRDFTGAVSARETLKVVT